jgi:hypothetical protein
MIWFEVGLRAFACVSAVIATLRAGSRALYLLEHDAIGVMDGPLILPSQNETNPMFEVSEAFRHSVRLSLYPQYYEHVRTANTIEQEMEPYSLFPMPISENRNEEIINNFEESDVDTQHHIDRLIEEAGDLDTHINRLIEEAELEEDNTSSLKRQLEHFQRLPYWISSSVKRSYEVTKRYVVVSPKIASYWTTRAWNWRSKNAVDEIDDTDWDYNLLRETKLRHNSTGIPQVADLAVYSPDCFANLRSLFGISEDSYGQSIFSSGPFVSFQSNSKGAARAHGVFFFSRDGSYMIKTIKNEEAKTLLKMLPKYHQHMKRHGRQSLLTRFCGLYRVRIREESSSDPGEFQTFVVMNSVFPAEASKFISERFDLKGSTVGREVSEEERLTKGSNAVLKDLDLAGEVELVRSLDRMGASSTNYGFHIGVKAKAALLSQLRQDVKLLVDCQVMDYSMLVGVVNMDTQKLDSSAREALTTIRAHERELERASKRKKKVDEMALYTLAAPLRLLISPPLYISRKLWSLAQLTASTILTVPFPYYGSGNCGVDGGAYSVIHGNRRGDRAVYYMGLIDFLQPWTTRKVLERKLKGIMGYDISAISCVTPEEYASRFLEFIDAHVS